MVKKKSNLCNPKLQLTVFCHELILNRACQGLNIWFRNAYRLCFHLGSALIFGPMSQDVALNTSHFLWLTDARVAVCRWEDVSMDAWVWATSAVNSEVLLQRAHLMVKQSRLWTVWCGCAQSGSKDFRCSPLMNHLLNWWSTRERVWGIGSGPWMGYCP